MGFNNFLFKDVNLTNIIKTKTFNESLIYLNKSKLCRMFTTYITEI